MTMVQETVVYVVCTIHPFDQSVILTAFGIDTSAQYGEFGITNGEAITNMSNALKMTMYGTLTNGMVPPITDAELNAYLNSLTCSGKRKELMWAALSLVGKVPYFWGGKSAPGWSEAWNTPRLVTSAGSSSAGGVALNSPTYVTQFRRRKDIDLEADFTPAPIEQGVNDG
ncbi:MAG: hypothetical protein NC319_03605 [Butyricicoccus sp.]|nr:hypothetical protein [Butyricicoccus sp.]